jgi:hypothetical protein
MIFDDINVQILKIDEGNNRIQAANNRITVALQTIQSNPAPGGGLTEAQAQSILAALTIEGDASLHIADQVEANATLAELIAGQP